MTIQERLNVINDTFKKFHSDFARLEAEHAALITKYDSIAAGVRLKWQNERGAVLALKDDVLKYYRIAKENSNKELLTSGISGLRPDIAKLNNMIERVDINNRNDTVAGQIVDLASKNVVHLESDLQRISNDERNELAYVTQQQSNEAENIKQRKKSILYNCENYLYGKDIKDLVRLFEMIHNDYEITDSYFSNWGTALCRKRMMLLGFQDFPIDVPQTLCAILKQSLGHHFSETTKTVNCPCGYTTDSHEDIFIEYTDKNEADAKSGIQALLLNYLRYFKPTEYKISIFDYIHFNADILGPLYAISLAKNGIIERVASDSKSLKQSIMLLASYYHKIEQKIGTESVYQYNKYQIPSNRIPYRILIVNRMEESFRTTEEQEMLYVLNNAEKFGVTVLHLTKSSDGGSKGKDREKKYLAKAKDYIRLISDANGMFFIENDTQWMPFRWIEAPASLPQDFITKITNSLQPKVIGCHYFSRYNVHMPSKSTGKRKPLSIPFAIDDDDNAIECNFENETFAAYIMGAAGSGKSTLLHTIISGLLMNYHPDEVELWLLDFKMLEFKRYVDNRPPHVKYLLLEKSEDLVFDIIDRLTELMDERQYLFSQNGWSKLTDVPVSKNMPAIFIIIDEFAQMSQILKETKGAGYGSDYTIKLENLLAKGRALGLKFIFASQTYTTGISGLTETACKQIQMRFALKNTADEIKQTLTLSSDELTPELSNWISSLPAYETLFKWRDNNGDLKVGRFKNMYTEGDEIEAMVKKINGFLHPIKEDAQASDSTYVDKKPVLIDGSQPKTFASQIPYYKEYEASAGVDDLDDEDILVYPGVPCSFNLARPFVLCNGTAENILIAGGDRDSKANIILSIFNSYGRSRHKVEIWSHERSSIYKKYKNSIFAKRLRRTDLAEICEQIDSLKASVLRRESTNMLIVCFGCENLFTDFEILGADDEYQTPPELPRRKPESSLPDMSEILDRVKQCSDPEEKKRIISDYNQQKALFDAGQAKESTVESVPRIYDARADMQWLIKRAPNYGIHFVLYFDQARDFINLRLDENAFRHKILFPMSKDESLSILGNRKANEVGEGSCVYSNGKDAYTLRPHIYHGLPCNGWTIDDNGKMVQRR